VRRSPKSVAVSPEQLHSDAQAKQTDRIFNEQQEMILALQKYVQSLTGDYAALKNDFKSAMAEVAGAFAELQQGQLRLKDELTLQYKHDHEEQNKKFLDYAHYSGLLLEEELAKLVQHRQHEAKSIPDALEPIIEEDSPCLEDEHQQNRAVDCEISEDFGLQHGLGSTQRLREQLHLLDLGVGSSLEDLSRILADVTQQIDNLEQVAIRRG